MTLTVEAIEKLAGVPLRELKRKLETTAGNLKMFVFGSYARGDFSSESDIDLLIVVPNELSQTNIDKIRSTIDEFAERYRVFLAPIIITEDEFINKIPLRLKIEEEGVEVE